MLQTGLNSEFSQAMDLFQEIDDLSDLFLSDKNTKLDSSEEGYEDLQCKYSNLHENYAKEIENSKKIEKCLIKCLKFYSKLCKKYEVQQKVISNLEASVKEKTTILEEALRNEERMKGLVQVYKTERALYLGQTNDQLRKDKEILLDICCKVISDPSRNHNIRTMTNLLLRKFRKDLSSEMLNLLKEKSLKAMDECSLNSSRDLKPKIISERPPPEEFRKSTSPPLNVKNNSPNLFDYEAHDNLTESEAHDNLTGSEAHDNLTESEAHDNLTESEAHDNLIEKEAQKLSSQPKISNSIFEISDGCSNPNISPFNDKRCETVAEETEFFSCVSFEKEVKLEDLPSLDNANEEKIDSVKPEEEEAGFPYEEELCKIFREMSSKRFLSPIRESTNTLINNNFSSAFTCDNETDDGLGKSQQTVKRNSKAEENSCKSKKVKLEQEAPNFNLLDSIMSAMSIQNEEFKSKGIATKPSEKSAEVAEGSPSKNLPRRKRGNSKENSAVVEKSAREIEKRKQAVDKLVTDEIKNFVSSPISSKEDADKNVGHCLSVLSNKSEDVIAKCIVALVLENVDEAVEIFERPSPPLTKTQHRLIVLLSVFRTLDSNSENITTKILSLIWDKIFPDNFFWPDDSIEAACRFYAALCRGRNDPKTLWRFCLHSMVDMRQRCPLLMFTVLKTWPDILHDASTLKNNLLALTCINIFLHMPKKEGFRNFNQGRKLVALKHLLMNFYRFKVEDSIENYAKKVFEALCREELGSEKSMVLLCKCQNESWTVKNVLPMFKSTLADWSEERVEDTVAYRILSVMKQICPVLLEGGLRTKFQDIIACLSGILNSAKKNHDSEVYIIEVLLLLKQSPEVRKIIREWIPKKPINDALRNEIINVSAENILREVKLNKRKEPKNLIVKKKLRKELKKSKVKKKGKKRSKKNITQKSKVESFCS